MTLVPPWASGPMLSPSDDQLTTELTIPSQKYEGSVSPGKAADSLRHAVCFARARLCVCVFLSFDKVHKKEGCEEEAAVGTHTRTHTHTHRFQAACGARVPEIFIFVDPIKMAA